jgi:hypothetical protein
MFKLAHLACLLVVLFGVAAAPCLGQTGTSSISGTVRDSTGAVVPGVVVTAKNEATGVAYTQTTTDAGLYAFPSLPVGSYTISTERSGFKTTQRTGNVLVVDTPLTVDLVLEVGQVTEVVTVQGGAEQLQTSNATIGNVVEQKSIEALPLNGRNPLTLITLEPGVVQRSAGAAGSGIHVNGSRDRAFNVTIDGIEANESSVPNPVSNLYRLNPDNVREYKVTTNNATPEEGRNSGASVSVATRSGTNDLHGTAFYFLRNDALNANEFFNNAQGIARPNIKLHQYGFELGGPVKKNKTFFFGSFQGNQINFTQPIDQAFGAIPAVYTPTALAGVFRYFRADPTTPFRIGNTIITRNTPLLINPATGALRPEVRTCASATDTNCVASYNIAANDPRRIGLDPVIGALLASYPRPNTYVVGDGLNTGGFFWNPPTEIKGPAIMARIDHTFSENHSLFGRYLYSKYDTLKGDPLNGRPQVFPGFPPQGEVFRTTHNLAIGHRWVISPRVINEFTTGFARFVFLFTQGEANPNFPNIPPFDFTNVSEAFLARPRTFRTVTTPQFLDNLSLVRGSHLFRLGLNFRFYRHIDQRGQPGGADLTPILSFDQAQRQPTAAFNTPPIASGTRIGINSTDNANLFNAINELLGIPARLSQTFIGDLNSNAFLPFIVDNKVTLFAEGHHIDQYNFYVQDEWKVRPNLTLNYGARWEINPAPTTAGGRVYVPDRPIVGAGPVTFIRADRWFARNNVGAIAPRLGIAWSPGTKGKTVVRAGYGIAFDTISSFQITAIAGRVPGLTTNCSSIPGGATTAGCAAVPDLRIAQGFPQQLPAPTVKPADLLTPQPQLYGTAPALTMFDPQLKVPTVHQWSLSVQHELPFGLVGQAAYIGRRGTRLFRLYDINQVNADPILPSFLTMQQNVAKGCRPDGTNCPAGATGAVPAIVSSGLVTSAFVNFTTTQSDLALNAAGNFAGRVEQNFLGARLRPNQQFSTIAYLDSGGDSYYHGAQFTLRRRFSSGFGISLAYTFAKSIDNQSTDPVGPTSGSGITLASNLPNSTTPRAPTDARDFGKGERARSDFDRRHTLSLSSVWELPLGRGQRFMGNINPALNQILGGWSLNTIYNFMTGEPFSVRSGVRTSNYSHESRADLVRPIKASLHFDPDVVGPLVFADSTAFAIPAPGSNGAGRNIFTAPNYWNLDIGIIKRFQLTERINLQFRAEMFNAFNHPNFDNPRDASVGSPSFRSSLFGQTCCAAVAPPSSQTIIQTGEAARVIQFALKLQW